MGNKIKYFLGIVFFPISIIFLIGKFIIYKIKRKLFKKYLTYISVDKIDALDGLEFEEFLLALFISKGYKGVKTKKSHDYGADLILTKKNISIAVQCKLYYKHTVGNSAVQEVATAKEYYNTNLAVVITNSVFTKPAIILAEKIGVELIDRNNLLKLIQDQVFDLIK